MYRNMKRSESTEQMTLIDWCNINTCIYPELELIYHIPNEGKRSNYQGKKLNNQGYKAVVCNGFEEARDTIKEYIGIKK